MCRHQSQVLFRLKLARRHWVKQSSEQKYLGPPGVFREKLLCVYCLLHQQQETDPLAVELPSKNKEKHIIMLHGTYTSI